MNKYIIAFLIITLLYTRFVGLAWGLPYSLHPDELNMVIAMMGLKCQSVLDIASCMNPHFFAYGQPPLYLGYILVIIFKFFGGNLGTAMSYSEATIALRFISATCSLVTIWYMWKIVKLLQSAKMMEFLSSGGDSSGPSPLRMTKNTKGGNLDGIASSLLNDKLLAMTFFIIAIFTPGLIQFAHFGTTESILMACYTAIIYYLLNLDKKNTLVKLGLIAGVAITTKVSALLFLVVISMVIVRTRLSKMLSSPLRFSSFEGQAGGDGSASSPQGFSGSTSSLFRMTKKEIPTFKKMVSIIRELLILFGIVAITTILLSPHNLINWSDFISAMGYESGVGAGIVKVFYTTQFENTIPVVYQFMHIFPYSLGFWQVFAFIMGFILLPYNRYFNILRLAFLVFFIPSAFLYAKWTRFVAPAIPLMLIFSVYCTSLIYSWVKQRFGMLMANLTMILVLGLVIFQGTQFMSIYIRPDVRFEASEWINANLPKDSFILSEERNVANTPIENNRNFQIVNFDFYEFADNIYIQNQLDFLVKKADYIIVPSRRVFANYGNDNYPQIKKYYGDLNNGNLGFKLIKEFRPTIINDEQAEETFSVFDHPVIRVYKRI